MLTDGCLRCRAATFFVREMQPEPSSTELQDVDAQVAKLKTVLAEDPNLSEVSRLLGALSLHCCLVRLGRTRGRTQEGSHRVDAKAEEPDDSL